jgi:hypothetical protein
MPNALILLCHGNEDVNSFLKDVGPTIARWLSILVFVRVCRSAVRVYKRCLSSVFSSSRHSLPVVCIFSLSPRALSQVSQAGTFLLVQCGGKPVNGADEHQLLEWCMVHSCEFVDAEAQSPKGTRQAHTAFLRTHPSTSPSGVLF